MTKWSPLGEGTYNRVYLSDDGLSVLKIQKDKDDIADSPERSVRLWNEINPHLAPPAYIEKTEEFGEGWICPFVKGKQASDSQISNALIDIYNRCGRIVVDAASPKNFITTTTGQVVCVDIGMALQMDWREEVYFDNIARRRSTISLTAWEKIHEAYNDYFQTCKKSLPTTIDTTKALLFIKSMRPNIFDASFLKQKPELVTKLAAAYDEKDVRGALIDLDKNTPISLDNIRASCIKELKKYIDTRGLINKSDIFEPNLVTKFFRNNVLTTFKVEQTRQLIKKIETAGSIDALQETIEQCQENKELVKATFRSGLSSSLGKCLIILEVAKQNPEMKPSNSI